MDRLGGRRRGFTMVELLVVIAIISLLAAFLLPVIAAATASARRANCSNKQRQMFAGLRMYLNNFEEYFPVAYVSHEAGSDAGTKDALGYISYWRFLIHEYCEAGFNHIVITEKGETTETKLTRDKLFWSDPAKGYTTDYFGPIILFTGWKDSTGEIDTTTQTDKFDKHVHFSQATADVSSTQRPVLTASDAGYPAVASGSQPDDWKGRPDETGPSGTHKSELMQGWSLTAAALPGVGGYVALVGASKCMRVDSDYTLPSFRFDFRHNKSINVLFLDGHVDMVTESNQTRVRAIIDAWNNLAPLATTE